MRRMWRCFAAATALIQACTVGPVEHAAKDGGGEGPGSSSETVGIVYLPSGEPAAGARARFISVDHSAAARAGSPGVVDSALSDSAGVVRLDGLVSATYNFEYDKDGRVARRDSVAVDAAMLARGDTLRDTLRAPGSLHGVVRLQAYHDARRVLIVLFGTERVVAPFDSAGNFAIQEVAAGRYDAHVMALYEDYGVLSAAFTIRSGMVDTLNDTLVLPFHGPARVEELRASYDTAWQVTTLSWSEPEQASAAGFRVYRTGASGRTELLTPAPLSRTWFSDTLWFGDSAAREALYHYRVRAVDTAGAEGPSSPAVTVTAAVPYDSVGAIGRYGAEPGMFGSVGGMALGPDSSVYICDGENNRIQVFDRHGLFRFAFGDTGAPDHRLLRPHDIAVGPGGSVYVAEYEGRRVHKLTASGEHVAVFGGEGSADDRFGRPCGIAVDRQDLLYVLDERNAGIAVWSDSGDFPKSLMPKPPCTLHAPRGIRMSGGASVLVADAATGTLWMVGLTDGGSAALATGFNCPSAVGCDTARGLVYVAERESGYLFGADTEGHLLWRWHATGGDMVSVLAVGPDEVWVGSETRVIRCRRRGPVSR